MAEGYDIRQMIKAGPSERQIRSWTEKGFLELSDRADWAHQGIPRLWTLWAHKKAGLLLKLTEAGLLASQASALLEQEEAKQDIMDGRKWFTANLASGIEVRVALREDWE